MAKISSTSFDIYEYFVILLNIMGYKFIKIFIIILFAGILSLNFDCVLADNADMLKAGVSVTDSLPNDFFGTWRVVSNIIDTDSPSGFKKKNVDIWNLSRSGDVVYLSNPFSGAQASVNVDFTGDGAIRFTKQSTVDNKQLTDTVELYISKNKFSGVNTIKLDTLSDVDGSIVKTAKATYTLAGEKISGE